MMLYPTVLFQGNNVYYDIDKEIVICNHKNDKPILIFVTTIHTLGFLAQQDYINSSRCVDGIRFEISLGYIYIQQQDYIANEC